MKNYESPVVLQYEDLAEGIYAASGVAESEGGYESESNCWSIDIQPSQSDAGGYCTFRVQANHSTAAQHISSETKITIVFSRPVSSVEFEGFSAQVNGATVILTRASHGNSYGSGDNFNSLLKVWTDNEDYKTLTTTYYTIECTKQVNVHGIID